MLDSILSEIDEEIARLQAVKALLSSAGTKAAARKLASPAATAAAPAPAKKTKHRRLSVEARDRMRQAQIKRWAALRKSERANLNATVSPIPAVKRKSAKGRSSN